MKSIKIQQLGWVAAIAMACVMVAGFQAKKDKIGVIDVARAVSQSEFAKAQNEQLKAMATARQDLLEFVNTYRVIAVEQANRFRELSVKPQRTPAEQAEFEKLKADVIATNSKYKDLNTKQNPTDADKLQLVEFNRRSQTMGDTLQRWAREFDDELQKTQDKMRLEATGRIKEAVQQIGAKQGYTLVFVQDVVPYGANDVTDDAKKAMNSKK